MRRWTNAKKIGRLAMLGLALTIGCGMKATAQASFEDLYGGACNEGAFKGTSEVRFCAGGGYISAGYSLSRDPNCQKVDAYVERTRNDGRRMWGFVYDIGAANGNDVAYSIRELNDGSGFIVTGSTDLNIANNQDLFLMKIDCNGGVVWTRTYGAAATLEVGSDVIQAATTAIGNPYDLVVAGLQDNPAAGTRDAYLLRTDALGNIVWGNAYNRLPGIWNQEWLRSVTEAAVRPGQAVGDIIAVGGTRDSGMLSQGYMLRVDGFTGFIGAAPQGAAHYGGSAQEELFAVVELAQGTEAGNVVAVGYTGQYVYNEIYMVKTNGDPCGIYSACGQQVIGDAPIGVNNDEGYDLKELTTAFPNLGTGAVAGDLVLTGATNDGGIGFYDAFLLATNPCMQPIAGSGNLFAVVGPAQGIDVGYSLSEVTGAGAGNLPGFIIGGYSQYVQPNFATQQDLYLIKTNAAGATGCSNAWSPSSLDPNFPVACPSHSVTVSEDMTQRVTASFEVFWRKIACANQVTKRSNGSDQGDETISLEDDLSMLRFFPNPVKRGSIVNLEFAASTAGTITVNASDEIGRTIYENKVANDGTVHQITVSTEGWAVGVYMVTIDDGQQRRTARMVVVE